VNRNVNGDWWADSVVGRALVHSGLVPLNLVQSQRESLDGRLAAVKTTSLQRKTHQSELSASTRGEMEGTSAASAFREIRTRVIQCDFEQLFYVRAESITQQTSAVLEQLTGNFQSSGQFAHSSCFHRHGQQVSFTVGSSHML